MVKDPDSGLESVKFTPDQATLLIGDTQQFTATAFWNDGTQIDVTDDANTQWTSFDTGIADFISTAGLLTAISEGIADTRGFYTASPSWFGNSKVVVKTPDLAIDEIIIVPEDALLLLGTTRQYRAYALMSDGTQVEITHNAAWSVANSLIVEPQNTTGLLLGRSIGSTTVKVSYDYQGTAFSSATQIFVIDSAPSFLEVTPVQQTLSVDESSQYTAILHMENGQILDVTQSSVWAVDDAALAHIDNTPSNTGFLTTLATGEVIVTANFKGQLAQTAQLSISDAIVTAIQVTPANAIFPEGTQDTYTAIAYYSDNNHRDISHDALWTSGDTATADIYTDAAKDGVLVRGFSAGVTTITASYKGLDNTVPVTITAATLDQIIVTPINAVRQQETSLQYTATGIYSDLSTADITHSVTWTSSDTLVAWIEDAGLAHTRDIGQTMIKASLDTLSGTVSNETTLTVIGPILLELHIEPREIIDLAIGNKRQLTVYGLFEENGFIYENDLTNYSVWRSEQPDTVAVSNQDNSKGMIQALQESCVTIYAVFNTVEAEALVCTSAAELLSIDITPTDQTIAVHSTVQYKAVGHYSDNIDRDITDDVTWISDNSSVATIDLIALATGIQAGSANIIAHANGKTGTTSLTVVGNPITQMWITPGTDTFPTASEGQLHATALRANGDQEDITDEVSWISQTPQQLFVDVDGSYKALATGTATVEISHPDYDSSSADVLGQYEIVDALLLELEVFPYISDLPIGLKQQYSAIGHYDNGLHLDLTESVIWRSDSPRIATIDTQGLLTAQSAGTAAVMASFEGQNGDATINVTAATVKSFSLSPYEQSLFVGEQLALQAIAIMTDNSVVDVTLQSHWQNNTPALLSLETTGADTGLIEGLKIGDGEIAISFTESNGNVWNASSQYFVTAVPPAPTGMRIEPLDYTLAEGLSVQYRAYAIYPDSSEEDISTQVDWSSSQPEFAEIDSEGHARAIAQGSTTITANWFEEGFNASTTLTVEVPIIDRLVVTPVVAIIDLLQNQQYKAELVMTNGDRIDVTDERQTDWDSSDILVAWISNTFLGKGKAHSVSFGQTNITAAFEDDAGNVFTDTVTLNVTSDKIVEIRVTVKDDGSQNPSIIVGEKIDLRAEVVYESGAVIIVTSLSSWESADQSIAVVDNGILSHGRVTGESNGVVEITATYHNVLGSTTVTVTNP